MTAVQALESARAAGITLAIEGDHLVLDAFTPPSADILEALSRYKAEILILLRSRASDWSSKDWQAFFEERASMGRHAGLGRLDAEVVAFEDCVDHWLAVHLPLASQHGHCLGCGSASGLEADEAVAATCSDGQAGRLHAGCAARWNNLRRWKARTALIWLFDGASAATYSRQDSGFNVAG